VYIVFACVLTFCLFVFLQRVSIACYAERCISHSKSVRLSVCLSVTRWHCVKTTQAIITGSSLEDSPMTLVASGLISARNSKGNMGSEGAEWERGRKNRQFLANKSPYLRSGARYNHSYNERLIGSRTRAFDWYQNHRPWMTLNGQNALWCFLVQKRCLFWSPLHKFEWR